MSFWSELKRRNVFRVAIAYAVVAWLLLQAAGLIMPMLQIPVWGPRLVLVFLVLGFPVAIFLSWAYELTPEGMKKTEALPRPSSVRAGEVAGTEAEGGTSDKKSIAVLPFVSMSSGEDDGYFADGLTEELLNALAQISELEVAGRTSSFYYKGKDVPVPEIGKTLGVAHVLEGSVRRSGERIRITAQLIEAAGGFHLWSETYDRTMDEIFAIQLDIAREVTGALKVALLGAEAEALQNQSTRNAEARTLYLIALARFREASGSFGLASSQINPAPMGSARDLFEEVTRLDPDYVEAWAGLVGAYLLLSFTELTDEAGILLTRDEGLKLAREALAKAEALAPDAPATLRAAALVKADSYFREAGRDEDLAAAFAAFERALAAEPDNVLTLERYASLSMKTGRTGRAIELYDRVLALDPLSTSRLDRAQAISHQGQLTEARAEYFRIAELYPDAPWQAGIADMEFRIGHLHHAILWMEAAAPQNVNIPFAWASLGDGEKALSFLDSYAKAGGRIAEYVASLKYLFRRDYEGLLAKCQTLNLQPGAPEDTNLVSIFLRQASFRLGHFADMIRYWELSNRRYDLIHNPEPYFPGCSSVYIELAHSLQQSGRPEQAAAIRARLRQNMAKSMSGKTQRELQARHEMNLMLLASEGQVEEAIAELEPLYECGWRWLMGDGQNTPGRSYSCAGLWFEDNPVYDSIRDEPGFVAFLNKVKADNAAMLAELRAGLKLEDIMDEKMCE